MRDKITYTLPVDRATIHLPFKDAYQRSGFSSYAELSEACGVPQSNLGKFFSGALKVLDITNLSMLATCLNRRIGSTVLSLDTLLGITEPGAVDAQIAALREENRDLAAKLAAAEDRYSVLRESVTGSRQMWRALVGIIFALLVLLAYVIVDASLPDWGVFRR